MTKLFNYDPYNDDFDEDKNFMRVLFRPGYSLQARELTQLQTILSNQIEKFGNHIFKNGSPITGGKISLDDRAYYLILKGQYSGQDIVLENFLDKTIVSYNSSKVIRAKVIAIDNSTIFPILIVKYLSGDFFAEGDELKVYGQNIFAELEDANATGRSYVASIQEGVYYFKGQFVKVSPQFLVLETYYRLGLNTETINKQPSYRIGIEFDELVIDEIDDVSLLDPAQGSFNYQAPGATRFKINTILSKRTLDSADESSFFEVIRIVDGVKTKEIDYPIYNEIDKTLARRTFDESGNYTVDPFVISLEEEYVDTSNNNYVDPNYFTASLDPGKAYVGGYEVQTIAPTKLQVSRGRATASINDYDLPTNYSSYVHVANVYGTLVISNFELLDIHCANHASVSVASTTEYNSSKIGTVRANMIKYNKSSNPDLGTTHQFTVNLFDANTSSITGSVASSGSTNTVIVLPSSFAQLPANSYLGMFFSIKDGAGLNLAPVRIKESSGSSKTITLSSALPFVPSSNAFSIDSDFKFAESLIKRSGSKIFGADITDDSKTNDDNKYAFITEPNRQGLIFDVPFDAIKEDTITNFDFFARKVYSDKTSSGSGIIYKFVPVDCFDTGLIYYNSGLSAFIFRPNETFFYEKGIPPTLSFEQRTGNIFSGRNPELTPIAVPGRDGNLIFQTGSSGENLYLLKSGLWKTILPYEELSGIFDLRYVENNQTGQFVSTGSTGSFVKLVATPQVATASGKIGEIAFSGTYLYAATGTNQWGRVQLSSW